MIDLLVSVVVPVGECEAADVQPRLERLASAMDARGCDYEIVVVADQANPSIVGALESSSAAVANLQIYCVSGASSRGAMAVAALEQAIGDVVIMLRGIDDDPAVIGALLARAEDGFDVVYARSPRPSQRRWAYRALSALYVSLFRLFTNIDLRQDTPHRRLLTRRVVNYVLQHGEPERIYLIAGFRGGFRQSTIEYTDTNEPVSAQNLTSDFERGIGMLVMETAGPIRLVSLMCLLGALMNLLYSLYVVAIYLFKEQVAPGWTTMSLQMSGMFFLLSFAVGVMAEYVVHVVQLATRRPRYHVSREFRSNVVTVERRLNVMHHAPERGMRLASTRPRPRERG